MEEFAVFKFENMEKDLEAKHPHEVVAIHKGKVISKKLEIVGVDMHPKLNIDCLVGRNLFGEIDETGIWDTPYSIDSDNDNYPLIEPWENYFKPPEVKIFDTGAPANPYPSIFGMHKGTIKPNVTSDVSKLYTYPCSGTGGHTEYARIWNSTLDVNATWNGYVGDWHNITFDEPFTLFAEKTYYYEVRTGSYPQIIHTDEWEAKGGMGIINCTSFVDANGKVHNDWIPAIRLE